MSGAGKTSPLTSVSAVGDGIGAAGAGVIAASGAACSGCMLSSSSGTSCQGPSAGWDGCPDTFNAVVICI
ncbi:hypothetical protein ACFV2U_46715 [Streptomyces sp. NPDC059697]|uniref:hypothetical protein n=1 Tax=Streptomyces sp. NPDC059697 TaxID=3346912 RepID=UPI0036A648CB